MSQNKGSRLYRQEYVIDDLEVPAEVCVGGFILIVCVIVFILNMYKFLQPSYGAQMNGMLVNPATASIEDIAIALNGFYSTYLERCIKENEEFALTAESTCYKENCQNNDKVCCLLRIVKLVTCLNVFSF
jgi:hypothetical protein